MADKQQPLGRAGEQNRPRQRIERIGLPRRVHRDLYYYLLTVSWPRLLLIVGATYFTANAAFAGAYLLGGASIAGARTGSFWDAFFFSVHTMATIGYGTMTPIGAYANTLVTIEALFGLAFIAVATALMFAKFSRPTARVLFSRVAVISSREGVQSLMFRLANERSSQIAEPQIRVTLMRDRLTKEGESVRWLTDLRLTRERSPFLALTWTVVHPIDEESPLFGLDAEGLRQCQAQFFVSITGLEETMSQTIHSRYVYASGDIAWNARFVDVMERGPNGQIRIDYTRFHDITPFA